MKYKVTTEDPIGLKTPCLVLGVYQENKLSSAAEAVDLVSDGAISELLRMGDMSAKLGTTQLLYRIPAGKAERLLLVGCGKKGEFDRNAYRKAVTAAANALKKASIEAAVLTLPEIKGKGTKKAQRVSDAVVEIERARYAFTACKGKPDTGSDKLQKIELYIGPGSEEKAVQAMKEGQAIAEGMRLARELSNLPGNICTPGYLAEQAQEMRKLSSKLRVEILEEEKMEKLGMGALLSVSRGSRQPAKLIVMEYRGGGEKEKPVVLVGKGLTFDAGGISLKPAAQMDEMKYDMCGGASVLGAMRTCLELKLPINLVVLVPTSENLPDGDANKPGDIVTSMSGQTIEVLNTDAEGRLILCDALTYAERFEPAAVVDVATLTGACAVALGQHLTGMFSDDEGLLEELREAGEQGADRVWPLPMGEEYQKQLESNFADMANIGGRYGGAITAACFLSRFTKKYPWAHLDIAGVAWLQGKAKGATGRPVGLLSQFLIGRSKQAK
jgi:leucyl aminopeptidase